MARINLLPWREEKRQESQQQFLVLLGLTIAGAIALVFLGNVWANSQIEHQQARNARLQSEIRALDLEIQKIDQLEKKRSDLLTRKQVIEDLQSQRSLTVLMLSELVGTTPVGVTLRNLRQQGTRVTITGTTQSNARVSAYLQNLMVSELFLNPELQIVEQLRPTNTLEPYDFTINITLGSVKSDEAEADDGFDEVEVAG